MDQVTYNVDVAARKTSIGWELTLDNGRDLQVTTLDDAAARVRTLLDIHQPQVDHGKVTVNLVIPPVISNDQDAPTPEATPRGAPAESASTKGESAPRPVPTPSRPVSKPAETTPTRTTHAPSARSNSLLAPSGLECMLWLEAAREKTPDFAAAATDVFPWIDELPVEQQRLCLGDLRAGLTSATEDHVYSNLKDAVARWKDAVETPGLGARASCRTDVPNHYTVVLSDRPRPHTDPLIFLRRLPHCDASSVDADRPACTGRTAWQAPALGCHPRISPVSGRVRFPPLSTGSSDSRFSGVHYNSEKAKGHQMLPIAYSPRCP